MTAKTVTASEFRAKAGVYLDDAARAPVIITKHDRPARVLLDVEEYQRLVNASGGLSEDRKRELREGVDYHRDTIMELSQR